MDRLNKGRQQPLDIELPTIPICFPIPELASPISSINTIENPVFFGETFR